jgi:hypothetical protein
MSLLPTDDKARKRLQAWAYLTEYFPDAFMAEVGVAVAGNEQHNPGQRLHWAREKSTDQMNTAFRHQLDYASGVKKDTDGQWHLAKAIWRLKAQLQLDIEAERAAQAEEERKVAEAAQVYPHAMRGNPPSYSLDAAPGISVGALGFDL